MGIHPTNRCTPNYIHLSASRTYVWGFSHQHNAGQHDKGLCVCVFAGKRPCRQPGDLPLPREHVVNVLYAACACVSFRNSAEQMMPHV